MRATVGRVAKSPTLRRRRLASSLRRLREESGLTAEEVADAVGLSKSAISRIENGQVTPRLLVVRALTTHYGVPADEAAVLEQLCRDAALKGWWQNVGDLPTVPDATKTRIGLEAEATEINEFSLTFITGLLQVPAYARAVLKAVYRDAKSDDIDQAVEVRLRRQDRLPSMRLWVILTEEALLRPIGGRAVMAEQVHRLIQASEEPKTTIQVLGRESGAHPGMAGGFTVMSFGASDPDVVYVEGNQWDACVEEDDMVAVYTRQFDTLRALALGPDDSRDLMGAIAKDYR